MSSGPPDTTETYFLVQFKKIKRFMRSIFLTAEKSSSLNEELPPPPKEVQPPPKIICKENNVDIAKIEHTNNERQMVLPIELIPKITDHLTQADVLTVCVLSKRFYSIGIRKLFKNIFVNSPNDDMLPGGTDNDFYRKYTVVKYKSFMKLAKLGLPNFIDKITFLCPKFSQTFFDCLQDSLPNTQMYIIYDAERLMNFNPKTLYQLQMGAEDMQRLLPTLPNSITALEVYGYGKYRNLDIFSQIDGRLTHLTSLSIFDFKWVMPQTRNQTFNVLKLKTLEIQMDSQLELICLYFDLSTITRLGLNCKHMHLQDINLVTSQLTSLTELSIKGNRQEEFVRKLPENTLKKLRLQYLDRTNSIDHTLERHKDSIESLSLKTKYPYVNGMWELGLERSESQDPADQYLINDLNKIPNKYPKLTFASIYGTHFIIHRCFGDFIEAEIIDENTPSRRSSQALHYPLWSK